MYETSLRLDPDQPEIQRDYAKILLWSGNHTGLKVGGFVSAGPLSEAEFFSISELLPPGPEEIETTKDREDRDDPIRVTAAQSAMYEGMVDVQDGRYEEALPKLESAIRNDPTLLGAWQTLGWAYWLLDRREDADELWSRLVTIAPDEPMGYNLLAQVATRDGDYDRAQDLYETSLQLNPDQYDIRHSYAQVLLWSGHAQPAIEILRPLLEEDPDRLDIEIDLAWAMYVNEEYEDVIERWNHIIEQVPDNPGFLMARANVLILLGALDEAERDAQRALEIEPQNAAALKLLASLAIRTRDPEAAVEALRRVMDTTENDRAKATVAMRIAVYMNNIYTSGSTVFSQEDIIDVIREALDLDDQQVGTYLFYGEQLIGVRKFAKAEQVFRHVLDHMNPYSERARFGLVETYFGRSMLDEAEQQLRENFRTFNPNNPFRHLYWARLYYARGKFYDALESLDQLEYEGSRGSVFCLLYHGINPSEFSDMPSVRQLREHLMVLRRNGFRFITPAELPKYFSEQEPAALTDERPWLNRLVEAARYAWTAQRPDLPVPLEDYTPDKVAIVTFDDALRNSFRYGTQVAQEMNIPLTMFVGVGDVLSTQQRYVASFPEIREYRDTGRWTIQSHLWNAGIPVPLDREGEHLALPIPNRTWRPDRNRPETLREYHARLRREFRGSRRVLAREMGLAETNIFAVAYPYGDVGQETESNIRLFDVPEVVLNEAEISYRFGFSQYRYGYAMKTDDPLLYKRWEPNRNATGRDVLREAYRQHPVFQARHMRAEIAALNGELHMALNNIERLKRDGYPDEDLAELNEYVRRRLARLVPLPAAIEDRADTKEGEPVISPRKPYVGIDARITRANQMIDDREYSLFGGLNLNPRLGLQVRAGAGEIEQTVETSTLVEEVLTPATETMPAERRATYVTEEADYQADKSFVGLALNYIHPNGAFSTADVRRYTLDGTHIFNESEFVFGLEHQWRPVLAIDLSARYQRGLVPSARQVITYDRLALNGFWRIRDFWHAYGLADFSFYEDKNSLVIGQVENYWRLSEPYGLWVGLHNSLRTMDQDSELYWSPYWEQRHYGILRLRRSYPNYSGSLRLHFGTQKSKARREDMDEYLNARAQGEAQGWSPGTSPNQGWQKLLGFSGTVNRTFENGFDIRGEFSVNSSGEYTEHNIYAHLLYTF